MDFATVTAVDETGPGRFTATIDPAWTIAGKPNGGYLLAVIGRAVTATSNHPHVIAASAHYLRPPEPGTATVGVQVLRSGRSAAQLRAWLSQDGHPCVEALFTTSSIDPDSKPVWSGGVPDTSVAAFEHCLRVPPVNPAGMPVPIMAEVDLRLDPATAGFGEGRPTGRGELRGWLALPHEAPFDPVSLLYAVDAFPPATFDVQLSGWVPTLELSVYVRALPAPGPVRVLHRAHLIDGDRVDESCLVWDSTDRLVATATQLAGIRL